MAGVIPVISAQGVIAAQNVWVVIILVVVLFTCTALMAGGTATEINFVDRTIRKTWQCFVFSWRRVYPLDEYAGVEIQAGNQLVEGYPLSYYTVSLIGKARLIKVYSTDYLEDVKLVHREISAFFTAQQ